MDIGPKQRVAARRLKSLQRVFFSLQQDGPNGQKRSHMGIPWHSHLGAIMSLWVNISTNSGTASHQPTSWGTITFDTFGPTEPRFFVPFFTIIAGYEP